MRVCPNDDQMAARVIDGEAVLIHLATGVYYSLPGAGAEIWRMIEARYAPEEMAAALAGRYGVADERARADVDRTLEALVAEGLVRQADDGPSATVELPGEPAPYRAPRLERYADLQDVLALDPPLPLNLEDPWST